MNLSRIKLSEDVEPLKKVRLVYTYELKKFENLTSHKWLPLKTPLIGLALLSRLQDLCFRLKIRFKYIKGRRTFLFRCWSSFLESKYLSDKI